MNVIAKIFSTEKFEIEGKKFVKLEGYLNDIGVFKQTVREEIVPDFLEGKECVIMFAVGVDAFCKPTLKIKGITFDDDTL